MLFLFFFFVNMLVTATVCFPGTLKAYLFGPVSSTKGNIKERKREKKKESERDSGIVCVCIYIYMYICVYIYIYMYRWY